MSYLFSSDGRIFTNRNGFPLFQLNRALIFEPRADIGPMRVIVPEGFITDLASVPRLPFIYWLLNGIADMPGVVHDFMYSTNEYDRSVCDKVFLDAMLSIGVSRWRAYSIYIGVRSFGAEHYNADA